MAVSVVEGRCTALRSGGITVSKLYELLNCEDKLVPIVTLMKNGEFTGEVVSKLIKIRCKEVEMVKQKASLLTTLTSICHLLRKGNTCLTLHAGYFIFFVCLFFCLLTFQILLFIKFFLEHYQSVKGCGSRSGFCRVSFVRSGLIGFKLFATFISRQH